MTELSSEANPQILVNGEQRELQQDGAATAEEQISPVSLDGEGLEDFCAAEKEAQEKLQSLFQQVRNQIRSQVGTKAPKNSILELVQRVKHREMEIAEMNSEPEGGDASSEEKTKGEMLTNESTDEIDLKEELCGIFEEKLKASEEALRAEFEEQIAQVRKEILAYTDQALKGLECKVQSWKSQHPQWTEQESKAQDKKQKPSVAPSLASRRGRVLTRTMTDIVPKTCAPVIIGPRAKSETLTSPKGESRRFLPRDPSFYLPRSKPHQSRKPLPPTCPPLHQRKKPVQTKAKTRTKPEP